MLLLIPLLADYARRKMSDYTSFSLCLRISGTVKFIESYIFSTKGRGLDVGLELGRPLQKETCDLENYMELLQQTCESAITSGVGMKTGDLL